MEFVEGDVLDLETVFAKYKLHDAPRPWLVTEDSAHTYEGCLAALKFLAGSMSSRDMLAMEDGNLVELGLGERYNGGPNRAIAEFFQENPGVFEVVEEYCDMYGPNVTYCPNGYLRRR